MLDGQDLLLEKIRDFAASVPLPVVTGIAADVEKMDTGNWIQARSRVLRSISQSGVRTRISQLLDVWQQHACHLPPAGVALALLAAARTEEHRRTHESVELVWTGPDTEAIALRRTDQALLQVIRAAQNKLLIVSFAVYKMRVVGEALVEAAGRGVDIMICVESPEPGEGQIAYDAMQSLGQEVVRHARVYRWPQEQRPVSASGRCGSLHAKCAVADDDLLFISSANLTEYAMTLNMELGVLIRGGPLPGKVVRHFERLIQESVLVRAAGSGCSGNQNL